MKIRNGFVSNSSSSSFIISKKKHTKATMTVEVDLEDFAEEIITDMQQLDDYFLSNYEYKTIPGMLQDDEDLKKLYNKCFDAITNHEEVIIGRVSNDSSNAINNMVYEQGLDNLSDNVTLIDNNI